MKEALDGSAVAVIVVWLTAFAVTATAMLIRHRSGRLVLRRADDRRRQAATNEASRRSTPLIVGSVLVLLAVGARSRGIAAAAIGGAFTALGPVLHWIAFVLRPDQRPNEDL